MTDGRSLAVAKKPVVTGLGGAFMRARRGSPSGLGCRTSGRPCTRRPLTRGRTTRVRATLEHDDFCL